MESLVVDWAEMDICRKERVYVCSRMEIPCSEELHLPLQLCVFRKNTSLETLLGLLLPNS